MCEVSKWSVHMNMQESWWEEKRSAYLYLQVANREAHPLRKKLFTSLAAGAENQANVWESKIKQEAPNVLLEFKPNLRTKFVGKLLNYFSVEKLRHILSAMKIRGMSVVSQVNHEHFHPGVNAIGNLRAAVFGVNDGLISNASLILGIAGASGQHNFIVMAGVAGLLAGACSMAAGEYISVRSQREVYEHQIALEKDELETYPEEEVEELTLIYEARGVPADQALKLAQLLISNPNTALDTLAREELGLNPDELCSPMGAMLSSFFAFAIGAVIPLLPFLISTSANVLWISIGLSGATLFLIGAVLSLFTNKNAFLGGLRMLVIGVAAGLATYFIGHWLGIELH